MKTQTWNVVVDDFTYRVEASNKEITVSPGTTEKIRKLKRSGKAFEQIYTVPVADKTAEMHVDYFGKRTLVYDGVDCTTGEVYVPFKMPAWGWVFVVLHAINFLLLIGGAIGGVLDVLLIGWTARIAGSQQGKTAGKVFKCIGIYVVSTIIELILVIFLAGVLYS